MNMSWIRSFLRLLKFWQKIDDKMPEFVELIPIKEPTVEIKDLKENPEYTLVFSNTEFDKSQELVDNSPDPNLIELLKIKEEPIDDVENYLPGESLEGLVDDRIKKLEEKIRELEEQPMYKFSETSLKKLETCHPDLQKLMKSALSNSIIDFGISVGERNQKEQDEAYRTGKSKLPYPKSKHNSNPSMAVDIFAFVNGKVTWELKYYYFIAGVVFTEAKRLGIKIRWGGNFNSNSDFSDDAFIDAVHFELVE